MKSPAINQLLKVRNTRKYGKGVFAEADIAKGRVIHILGGDTMTSHDLVQRVNSGQERIDDPLQVGRRTYIDLDDFSRSFNHSCNPNAGIRKRSELFALRDIRKGEEITYDYSATIAPTVWQMECKCGAKNCRKTLGDVRNIPKRQLQKYQKAGAWQTYMKAVLAELNAGRYRMPKYELAALEKLKSHEHAVTKRG
jgi:hypothetical protein